MDMDFAVTRLLVPRSRLIRFLFIDSRLCFTLPSDAPHGSRPCVPL